MQAAGRHGRAADRRRVRRVAHPTLAAVVVAVAICAGLAGPSAATAPAVRGLVIGIDRYVDPKIPHLEGAVNDARDLHRALAGAGVEDLVVLVDRAATRNRIAAEWKALVERADPGDTLVLTFAGHGTQEAERVAGSERDGKDEVLLLGGFRYAGPGTRERIRDDALNRWFLDAGGQRLRVIFVADACHSGTLTRSVDPRAPAPTYRYVPSRPVADDLLSVDLSGEAPDTGEPGEADLSHVSFLAAGQEDEAIPEIMLSDETGAARKRGALSYMFARAIRGEADLDGDRVLRRDELWRFVRENVRMVAEARQTPNLEPNVRGEEVVLRLPGAAASAGPAGVVGQEAAGQEGVSQGDVRLAVVNAGPGVAAAVREVALAGVRVVPIEGSPDLVWDARRRQVVSGLGDVIAHDVRLEALSGVVGKWSAVRALGALSARAGLALRVHPHDGLHRRGSRIEVEVAGLRYPRLTLLGLSGNGVVHYLYPLPGDPAQVPLGRPFRLNLEVTPPFGADHVVAVSAGRPLDTLNARLHHLDGRRAAREAAELLAGVAAGTSGWSSGIQGLYTAP